MSDDIEINQTVARSVLFRSMLPGGTMRYRTQSVALVVGTHDSGLSFGQEVDKEDLFYAISQFVDSWSELEGGAASTELSEALSTKSIKIRSPNEVLISPWPLQLECRQCGALQVFRDRDSVAMNRMILSMRNFNGRDRVPCPRHCGGFMRQLAHQSIHRCGSAKPLVLSHQANRSLAEGVRFEDKGSYGNSVFRNIISEDSLGNALQGVCQACVSRFPGADGVAQRGALVGAEQNDAFYVHSVQFLSLPADAGQWLRRIQNGAFSPGSVHAAAYWEGALAAILGLLTKSELLQRLDTLMTGGARAADSSDLAVQLHQAEQDLKEIQQDPPSRARQMLEEKLNKEITDLKIRVTPGRSGFSEDLDVIPANFRVSLEPVSTLQSRRTLEAVLLRGCTQETTVNDRIARASVAHKSVIEAESVLLRDRYGVLALTHLDGLQVNLASVGFSREVMDPSFLSPGTVPVVLNGFSEQSPTGPVPAVYAMAAATEALRIDLDPQKVLEWCRDAVGWSVPASALVSEPAARAYLLANCSALRMTPRDVARTPIPSREVAPFNLLHSFMHALLYTAKRSTGYGEGTLHEYLLPSSLSGLIYVSSLQNYTAGGLKAAFHHNMRAWLEEAAQHMMECIFDPYCTGHGSSCSGCSQLPRGCETFNRGISRAYLQGGIAGTHDQVIEIQRGFWSAR